MSHTPETTPIASPFGGDWNNQKSKLKVKFPTLTDADLQYSVEVGEEAEEEKEELLVRIQSRIGKTKQEVETIIASL